MMKDEKPVIVGACVLIAWLGEYVHNLYELPQLTILSPENSLVLLVGLVLFVVWYLAPAKRLASLLLLSWGLLHLVGGSLLSVLPLEFLPFYPEQSLQHYLMHVIYGLAQLPLIVVMLRELRSSPVHLAEGRTDAA
jgi:hypothetical protein